MKPHGFQDSVSLLLVSFCRHKPILGSLIIAEATSFFNPPICWFNHHGPGHLRAFHPIKSHGWSLHPMNPILIIPFTLEYITSNFLHSYGTSLFLTGKSSHWAIYTSSQPLKLPEANPDFFIHAYPPSILKPVGNQWLTGPCPRVSPWVFHISLYVYPKVNWSNHVKSHKITIFLGVMSLNHNLFEVKSPCLMVKSPFFLFFSPKPHLRIRQARPAVRRRHGPRHGWRQFGGPGETCHGRWAVGAKSGSM